MQQKRKTDVAKLCNVPEALVEEVTVVQVRQALLSRVKATILESATQVSATYWRVGERYFLDDPFFGDVVDFANLDYNSELGLYVQSE